MLIGRPLSGLPTPSSPFFIVGSGRCGSTLLRAILTVSSDVHVPPENHVLGGIIREYQLINRLPWSIVVRNALSRMEYQPHFRMFDVCLRDLALQLNELPPRRRTLAAIIDAIYMYHARFHKPAATRWGDKTPGNAERLGPICRVFPDLRVIHMIRDGRDVVRSFSEKLGRDSGAAAEQWVKAIVSARRFGRAHPRNYLEIRYESLIASPEAEIRKCCEFLALPFDDRMLSHHEHAARDREIRSYSYHREVLGPIVNRPREDWHTRFDAPTVRALEALLNPLLQELGYK